MNEETGSPTTSPETAPEAGTECVPTSETVSPSVDGAVTDGLPVDGDAAQTALDAGLVVRVIDIIHADGSVVMILIALSVIAVAIVQVKLM